MHKKEIQLTNYEIISGCVSLLAVIVAAISLFRTRRISMQQIELERITANLSKKQLDMLHAEEAEWSKAHIDVELTKIDNLYKFVITNIGNSEAKNIHFHLDGEGNPLIANEYADKIPVKSLKPRKSVSLTANFTLATPTSFSTYVRWNNPDGSQEKEEYFVSI